MPLQKQLATVPLLGLDTHVDPKSAPPGTLTTALNVNYRRAANGTGLEAIKRNGYTARTSLVVGGATVVSGRKLGTFNNEQLLLGDSLYSWSAAETSWVRRAIRGLPVCTVTAEPQGANPKSATTTWDMAVGAGLICSVWSQGLNQSARVVITDATTGAHVLDQDLAWSVTAGVQEIRVCALSTAFMICASFTGSQLLASKTIAFTTPTTISSEVAVTSALNASSGGNRWDMVRSGTNDWVLIGYYSATPNTSFVRWNSNQTSGGTSSQTAVGDNGNGWLTWDASDGNMYMAAVSTTAGYVSFTVNATTAGSAAATVIDASITASRGITGYRTGVTNIYFVGITGSPLETNSLISRSTGGAFAGFQRGLFIYGKPFIVSGRAYLPCANGDSGVSSMPTGGSIFDQRTLIILDVADGIPFGSPVAAKAFYGESRGALVGGKNLPGGGFLAAGKYVLPSLRTVVPAALIDVPNPVFDAASVVQAVWAITLDFSIPGCSPMTAAGDNLYLPGGVVKEFDGASLAEAGFHSIPIAPTLAVGGTATLTASSTYQCFIIWVYTDDKGDTHASAPSQPATINLGVGQTSFTALCQTYRFGERASNVMVEVYFTQANGSIFYLAGRIQNSSTADSVTFTPTGVITNAALGTQPQAYTTDGTLPALPLPPAKLQCSYRNRLIISGTEDNCDIWVSSERNTGVGLTFSDATIVQCDKEGGPILALASFDDRVIIFKRTAIFEIAGPGPAPSGAGGYDTPALITATVGALGPESLVRVPQGLMFQSARGFYVLPVGGGQPVRLQAIEGFEALTVTGAANLDSLEQARFTTSSGQTLVYHYGFLDEKGQGRWSIHSSQVAVDCAVFGGTFCWVTSAGVLQVENTTWDDSGAAIQMQLAIGWLNLAGLIGRHRLYKTAVVADWLGSTTVTMRHSVNFDGGTTVQTAIAAVTASSLIPLMLPNVRGDAYSHRFTIDETSTTQGFKLEALVLEIGTKGGAAKALIAQTFT